MDFSFYLASYIQSRISLHCKNIEIYIADSIDHQMVEIIVKDDVTEDLQDSSSLLPSGFIDLIERLHGRFKQLKHKGVVTLSVELPFKKKTKPQLGNFHSLLGMALLNHLNIFISFTFISPKGEYTITTKKITSAFDMSELKQKNILEYMNQLLKDEIDQLKVSL